MNRVRATIEGEVVIVAALNDQEWEYTEAGQALYNEHSNLAVSETEVVATKTRKVKAQLVESVEITDAPSVGLVQATE